MKRWDVASSMSVVSSGNSMAITPEKHCMRHACSDLNVCRSHSQRWHVALPPVIASDGNSIAISPEKNCMSHASRNHCRNQG